MMQQKIDNIIFDLGEVLIRLDFPHWLKTLQAKNPAIQTSDYELHYQQVNNPFSKGLIDENFYAAQYRSFLNDPDISLFDIKTIHSSLFVNGCTRSADLLPRLAERYKLYVLSNTDPWHIDYLKHFIPGYQHQFTERVYSYETHSLKPDKAIYDTFRERTGIDFTRTLYFDDMQANIDMGKMLDLTSILVTDEDLLYNYIENNLL